MGKPQVLFFKILIIEAILLTVYFTASIQHADFLCSIFSITVVATFVIILLYSFYISNKKGSISKTFPFYALACFSWFLGNLLTTIYIDQGLNPPESSLSVFIYFLTNVFLGAAVLIFMFRLFKKWNSLQLLLDTLVIAILSLNLIWISFFHKDVAWLNILMQDSFNSAICIGMDFLIILGFLITIFYLKKQRIPSYILLLGIGLALYAANDLYYYYIHAYNLYSPNSLTDLLSTVSLFLIALGALWKTLIYRDEEMDEIKNNKFKFSHRWVFLFLFPLIALLTEGFVFIDVMRSLLAIIIYLVLSNQVQLAIKKDELYKKELEINTILEKRIEEQYGELVFLANHDVVTKLHNRFFFIKSLEKSIMDLINDEVLAVFLIDIDRFKTINDSFGHDVGDEVLINMSGKMLEFSKDKAVLARLGGDEFALYFRGNYNHNDIAEIAEKMIEACSSPIYLGENTLYLTISVGISICPADANDRVAIIKNADIAMYRAKAQGYNKYVFYDPFFIESVGKKNEIELMLRKANIEKDFELYYQPQFRICDNKIIGAEALIRWKIPEHSYISPSEFIPVAEEINYIIRIGKWVMTEAVSQIIKWNTLYPIDLRMSINISPKQLREDDFISHLKMIINNENFNSTWIDAEITENILLECDNKIDYIFDKLKEMSISVSIDDFGSEYSSLGYLNKLSFDRIKIDKLLIDELYVGNDKGICVVKAIVSMAKAMGIKTIAEGVETEEQFNILKELNCDQIQGYLLGRPVSATDFKKLFLKSLV